MIVTHRLTITARCPVDGSLDTYECEVSTGHVVKVEDILAAVEAVKKDGPVYQENLTQRLAAALPLCHRVQTVGMHSGVQTTVIV